MQKQETISLPSRFTQLFFTSIGIVYALYTYAFFLYFSKHHGPDMGPIIYWIVEIIFLLTILIRLFMRRHTIAEQTGAFLSNIALRYLAVFALALTPMIGVRIFPSGVVFHFLNQIGESLALTLVKALVDVFVFGSILILWAIGSAIIRHFSPSTDAVVDNEDEYFDGSYS